MTWSSVKPNPYSFERYPDGSGRVWTWQYCKDEDCDICWVEDEDGHVIKPVKQCPQYLLLCNYDAWEHGETATTIKDSTLDEMRDDE